MNVRESSAMTLILERVVQDGELLLTRSQRRPDGEQWVGRMAWRSGEASLSCGASGPTLESVLVDLAENTG